MEELVEKIEDIRYLEDLSSDEADFIADDSFNINIFDRVDFLIDLKKSINEDNIDNYFVAFKKGYHLASFVDRESFLRFKDRALSNINLPYNEYSDMFDEKIKIKRR